MIDEIKKYGYSLPRFFSSKAKGLLIDGAWVPASSDKTIDSFNPSDGQLLGQLSCATEADVDRAVRSSRTALEGPWRRFTPSQRSQVLLKLADLIEREYDDLSLMDSLDMGVPIGYSRGASFLVLGTYRFAAAQALALFGDTIPNSLPGSIFSYTLKEPVGVVGGIIPWNGPLFNAAWKIAPVLATGCTMVLKCAEQACFSVLRIGELCLEAGVPPGVINIITGVGEVAGAALTAHPGVDKISFTGSTETGRAIVKASSVNFKRLTLELGGKSPNIVFADADLQQAVPACAMAVFANSGQICSAGSRLFVERPIYEEFSARLADFARSLRVGPSLDPTTQLGPLVSHEQLLRVLGYMNHGVSEGANAIAGGHRLTKPDLGAGYFVSPTVFNNVRAEMKIAREEIFGPVVAIMPFDDVGQVLRAANDTTYGLGSGVWTNNLSNAHAVAHALQAGSVWINCYQAMDPAVPFGGYKMSGYGREAGPHHFNEYLNVKSVWIGS